ncbi:hypothetical protein GCM10027514_07480 [Azotobacter armeniacus]
MATRSDVLLENFKVGGLAAYGLDYASLKVGMALTDILDSMPPSPSWRRCVTASGAALASFDLALLDVQVACLANQALNYLTTGRPPRQFGNAHPSIVPYRDFPTADGGFILAVGNDEQFCSFCEVAEHPEWSLDVRFATNQARVVHRGELIPLIRQVTVFRSTADWVAALRVVGVPCGPDQRSGSGIRRSANRRPRAPNITAAPVGRQGAAGGQSDPTIRHAGFVSTGASAAWRAHWMGTCRSARA